MRSATAVIATLLIASARAATSAGDAAAPEYWQTVAKQDIAAVRQAIAAAHPGAIDAENPGFVRWMEDGAVAALALASRVQTRDDMLAVVRFYIAGFQDGHVWLADPQALPARPTINGWHVMPRGDGAFVDEVVPEWPTALPPRGAQLLGCDGREAARILAEDLAPFIPAAIGTAGHRQHWSAFTAPPLGDMRWRSCRFRLADGTTLDLPQTWQEMPRATLDQLLAGLRWPAVPRANTVERLRDGTLWVRAGDFQPDRAASLQLQQLLHTLRSLPTPRRLVLDARGNGGGDSSVGQRIFDAATGGLVDEAARQDPVPMTSAWWRVSDIALASLAERERQLRELGGHPDTLHLVQQLRQGMAEAQARSEPWLHQPGSDRPRLTRADRAARHAHLRRPIRQVVLLTDDHCASACLNFADTVRDIPGALHLGETTSADTVYIDIGSTPLPSGGTLVLPLKVWRNRLRGHNEALVPDVPLDLEQQDEPALRRQVLKIIHRAPRLPAPAARPLD